MKYLSIFLLLAASSVLLFTTSCGKKELEKENEALKDSLEHHHCIHGAVATHDLTEPVEFKGGTMYVWFDTENEPGNTSSGYDVKEKAEVNYNADGLDFQIDELPAGIHWVHNTATATDSAGTTHDLHGGSAVEIPEDEHCASAHVHVHP